VPCGPARSPAEPNLGLQPMSEPELRIDPLTGAHVVVTPWRQSRPQRPGGQCPFCPGGLEAPGRYDVRWIPNRWPGLPGGRHEVILHSPEHDMSFPGLGEEGAIRVVELWSARTAVLGARGDVDYVFILENRGQETGTTIDHPHSQIFGFGMIPPVPRSELTSADCSICSAPDEALAVSEAAGWLAGVPWAPSWPYEVLIWPRAHTPDLPAAGPGLRAGLAAILVDSLQRVERLFGAGAPYMMWLHQRPTDGSDWAAAHLHLHLAPVLRKPGAIRHIAAAELGAGVLFDPVDPHEAAAQLRSASGDRAGGPAAAAGRLGGRRRCPPG
jgi:UDPglucose--hexose-1-phosphate uridylyltransferase